MYADFYELNLRNLRNLWLKKRHGKEEKSTG